MNDYAILTSRKRTLIALVHSVVFLGVALQGFVAPKAGILRGGAPASDYLLLMIYMTVSSILAWLVAHSGCSRERFYFVLCAGSATLGLLRTCFGDATLRAAQPLRAVALTLAIAVCTAILRSFPRTALEDTSIE